MKNSQNKTMLCPCRSGKLYEGCCFPFHNGKAPDSALSLMRSRFSAYALSLADYIISTTHPANSEFSLNTKDWKKKILEFSSHTEFKDLKILDFQDGEKFATVTFFAYLFQNGEDVSFTEKSSFEKVHDRWLYKHPII